MKKLITAIERTGGQIFDRSFLKVFLLGMLTTVGAILLSFVIANELVKEIPLYSSDDIIDRVEDKHYPNNKAGKRLGVAHLAFLALRIMFFVIILNLVVLPLYVLLFWIPPVPLAIFYLLNGYLLGWGYYEMVAVRHLGIKEAGVHRKSIRGVILVAGMIMTLLFMVPIVQFTVPILGAALICHLFHMSRSEEA